MGTALLTRMCAFQARKCAGVKQGMTGYDAAKPRARRRIAEAKLAQEDQPSAPNALHSLGMGLVDPLRNKKLKINCYR